MDCARLRTGRGHELFTVSARTRPRTWTARERGWGHGLDKATDWMRTVFGLDAVADWTWSRTGHGLSSGPVYGADIPRPNRDCFADTKTLVG
jgi:hypothetical protein